MQEPTEMMIWNVSDKMHDILSKEYMLNGATAANIWSVNDFFFDQDFGKLVPGSMVLCIKHDPKTNLINIVGGGYFLNLSQLSIKQAWHRCGVRNGVVSYDDFVETVKQHGGNEQSMISCSILIHCFVFEPVDYIAVPEAFTDLLKDKQRYILPIEEPLGHYINNRVLTIRDKYIDSNGKDWLGLYYVASHRNSKAYSAAFHARVYSAYNFQCAISGSKARPLLEVAHIQPFYNTEFQSASNGIVLRNDLYSLFRAGFLTLEYVDNCSKLICRMSKTLVDFYGDEYYLQFDGKELSLPEDHSIWPKEKYVLWHKNNCFESWLNVGSSHSV